MSSEPFSIDESGYTGFDLLNPDQRFQGATAIDISNEDAARLIKEHFPNLQAAEVKYGALARRSSNRERLLNLQRDALASNECVTFVCDKRYLLPSGQEPPYRLVSESCRSQALSLRRASATRNVSDTRCGKV